MSGTSGGNAVQCICGQAPGQQGNGIPRESAGDSKLWNQSPELATVCLISYLILLLLLHVLKDGASGTRTLAMPASKPENFTILETCQHGSNLAGCSR